MDKNQYDRYKIIDRILRSTPDGLSLDALLDRLNASLSFENNIQRRQLQYDLEAMRDRYDAPITNKRGARRVRYEDASYSIVTHEMITSLRSMEEQLDEIEDSKPRLQWLQNLILMLQDTYFTNPMAMEAIDFGDNLEYENSSRVHEFFSYIINRQVIKVTYNAGFRNTQKRVIHPYFIRQYNNRWFLMGYNPLYDDLSIVALDRIEGLEPIEKPFKENQYINFDNYFRNIIGISIYDNKSVEQVILKFTPQRLPYVLSKPLHHSQMIENRREGIVSIRVIPNKELLSELIRFGNDVEVLAPDFLREQIKQRIAQMYEIYFGVKDNFTTGS